MAETIDVSLRCRCGTVRGIARDVAPSNVNHCFCYCDDCQAFAHFLGRADDVLDAHGGTEITQISQANVAFTAGTDKLAAAELGPIRGRAWANRAKGGRGAVPKDGLPDAVMVARVLAKLLRWRVRGDHKRSAFFDGESGKARVEPQVLGAAEREELRQRCARWRGEAVAAG